MAVIEPCGGGWRQSLSNSVMRLTTWPYRRITGPTLLKGRAVTDLTPDTVGKRIKQTRKLRHITQTELALKSRISAPHMAQIEPGKRQAGPAVLASIRGTRRTHRPGLPPDPGVGPAECGGRVSRSDH
ncbi:helix-turn-helix domain-containing protein [Kitasatospora xanthocidica]|uniref:helix-turn-helix domain-containing protein n=1 Tax=Kitasatospora xanthocidica TaxID=83382 RepID=UPI0036EDD196